MIFQKKIQSETWTHPPTSVVNTDFLNFFFGFFEFFLCKVPKSGCLFFSSTTLVQLRCMIGSIIMIWFHLASGSVLS